MSSKPKKHAKVEHIAAWSFGNFCARCGKIDDENEAYGKNCYDKIQLIKDKLKASGIEIMTHKEFRYLIKSSTFCKPTKRVFKEYPICKALGVPQRRY